VHYWDLRKEAHESWQYSVLDELIYIPDAVSVLDKVHAYPEIYLEGHVWIELKFVLLGERDANYIAIIESLNAKIKRPFDYHSSATRDGLQANNVALGDLGELAIDFAAVRRDSSMFIEVTHGVEPPNRMRFIGIPSVIWLKREDFVSGSSGHSIGLLPEAFPAGAIVNLHDRKLSVAGIENSADALRQTPNEVIEARPHVVKEIANRKANVVGNVAKVDLCDMSSLLKIIIMSDRISFLSGERFEQCVESIQMSLRPTKLEIGVNQTNA
jgi:hypothetical protein